MSVSTIDGEIKTLKIKRQGRGAVLFDTIVFALDGGGEKTLRKIVAGPALAPRLTEGARGRFYTYTAVDHKGIHGMRSATAAPVYAFARNNETIMLVVALINIVLIVLYQVLEMGIPWFAVALSVFGGVMYAVYLSARKAAERQFLADEAYRPPA